MIVRRLKQDELYHYGVKGMKWRHHKRSRTVDYDTIDKHGNVINGKTGQQYNSYWKDPNVETTENGHKKQRYEYQNSYVTTSTRGDLTDVHIKNKVTGREDVYYMYNGSYTGEKYTVPSSLKSWSTKSNDPRYQKKVSTGKQFINKLLNKIRTKFK